MSALRRTRARNLGRFGSLLAVLLCVLSVSAFTERTAGARGILSVTFSVLLATGVYSASGRRRRVLAGALLLGVPALALEWVSILHPTPLSVGANTCLLGLFVAYVASVTLSAVLEDRRVTLDTIFGGIAIYLLLAVGWAFGYALIEQLAPGSYPFGGQPLQELHAGVETHFPELLYFSFVTLTTLGYGDMVPANSPARTFAVLEAVTGQLYVAIFIARLVALHITEQQGSADRD